MSENTIAPRVARRAVAWRRGLLALLLLAVFAAGVGVRRAVFSAQQPGYGRPLPFTLESALQYRLIRMAFTGEGIPAWDPRVGYPDGLRTFATDTVGAEYLYAALSHLFPPITTLPERVRWIEVGWFCLAIPLLAVWVRLFTGSWAGGFTAALYYAVALSAVIRSTGQEISHENFALPLLAGHLAAGAAARRPGMRHALAWGVLSGLLLAAALATWDLVQFYVALWFAVLAFRWYRAPFGPAGPEARAGGLELAGLALAGAASPYLRAHGFLLGPVMLGGLGIAAGTAWLGRWPGHARAATRARWLALVPLLLLPAARVYGRSYGHFANLLWAKLRYLNVKPADPALLTFDQRIMWTPALHSATWRLAWLLFPCLLVLTSVAIIVCWARRRGEQDHPRCPYPVLFFQLTSFFAFILFVRFHVYTALFSCALVGWLAAWSARRRGWRRALLAVLLVAGGLGEAANTLTDPGRWGRSQVFYPQLAEMGAWLKQNAGGAPVLATFGTSAYVLTYADCPIVLHPKFESPEIRERVRTYGTLLFRGTEQALRDWADRLGAKYLVYGRGGFSSYRPEYQMRYMVNAMDPPVTAPARIFEKAPEQAKDFRLVWSNAKYLVFRIRSRGDAARVAGLVRRARTALQEGRLGAADAAATEAQRIQPGEPATLEVLRHVGALRAAGFGRGAP